MSSMRKNGESDYPNPGVSVDTLHGSYRKTGESVIKWQDKCEGWDD